MTSSGTSNDRVKSSERSRDTPAPGRVEVSHLTLELCGFPGKPLVFLFEATHPSGALHLSRDRSQLFMGPAKRWFQRDDSIALEKGNLSRQTLRFRLLREQHLCEVGAIGRLVLSNESFERTSVTRFLEHLPAHGVMTPTVVEEDLRDD